MDYTAHGGMSHGVDNTLRTIFKRCLQCPPTRPSCPTGGCADGEICSLVPAVCNKCAHTICIKNPTPETPTSSGPNVGAIAGGVVGGVAFISIVVFLVWRFWIKKRREEQDRELAQEWEDDEIASQKRSTTFTAVHDGASVRTRGSLANSILSRASNIIQIAYIPGVTNRNGSGRNSIHAPVPPIPAAHRQTHTPKSPLSHEGDALFFGIGDLRDSTYSATSSVGSRDTRYGNNRYTMASITPSLARDSVASDSYFDSATAAPMPATTAARAAARVVSVKSSNSNSSGATPESRSIPGTPPEPMPGTNSPKPVQVMVPGQGSGLSPSPSIRAKATEVTVGGKGKGRFPVRNPSDGSSLSAGTKHAPVKSSPLAERNEDSEGEEDTKTNVRQSLIKATDFASSPPAAQPPESPFYDASEALPPALSRSTSPKPNPYASMASTIGASSSTSPKRRSKSIGGLTAVLEEEAKRASKEKLNSKGDASPFGDEHATDDE